MDVRTHLLIANMIYSELDPLFKPIIKKRNFLYGNVKPDMISTYKFKKHYRYKSYEAIISKINKLSKIKYENITRNKGICFFSQELGVVCHFICDFFCVPHNERWEFKHSMIDHINYEKLLNKTAKEFEFKKELNLKISSSVTIDKFLDAVYISYNKDTSLDTYSKDLHYSYIICYMVVNTILDKILSPNNHL